MSLDTVLGFVGLAVSAVFGVIGVAVGFYGVRDGRRERSRREVAVNAVHDIMGRTEGLLIGLKPSVVANSLAIEAINNGIDAVTLSKQQIKHL